MMDKKKRYKLKDGEEWDDTAFHHYPHYCPNCGEPMSKPQSEWTNSNRPSESDNPFRGLSYDCYCPTCHWGGHIEPDADRGIIEKRMEFVPYEQVFGKHKKKKVVEGA